MNFLMALWIVLVLTDCSEACEEIDTRTVEEIYEESVKDECDRGNITCADV